MVNVAEDVKEPRRNMPRAIFLTVVCSILPYMIVASAVVHTVASVELALHGALVYQIAAVWREYPRNVRNREASPTAVLVTPFLK